jgi:rubrerythrin
MISERTHMRLDLARKLRDEKPGSWYCEPCAVAVYDRRCPRCGKLERDKT